LENKKQLKIMTVHKLDRNNQKNYNYIHDFEDKKLCHMKEYKK